MVKKSRTKKLTCTSALKSEKLQNCISSSWKKYLKLQLKHYGGIVNTWEQYRDGFEKGFMIACKTRKQRKLPPKISPCLDKKYWRILEKRMIENKNQIK